MSAKSRWVSSSAGGVGSCPKAIAASSKTTLQEPRTAEQCRRITHLQPGSPQSDIVGVFGWRTQSRKAFFKAVGHVSNVPVSFAEWRRKVDRWNVPMANI